MLQEAGWGGGGGRGGWGWGWGGWCPGRTEKNGSVAGPNFVFSITFCAQQFRGKLYKAR